MGTYRCLRGNNYWSIVQRLELLTVNQRITVRIPLALLCTPAAKVVGVLFNTINNYENI